MVWCVVSRANGTPCILPASAHYTAESMVAQAGQPPGWPVSDNAGISTPVWAIAIERGNSGDSVIYAVIGGCLMATTLTPSHPEFVFVFAAVRRADRHPRICMLRTVAGDERSARRSLVRDYVLSLAARLPVVEVSRCLPSFTPLSAAKSCEFVGNSLKIWSIFFNAWEMAIS